MAILDLDTLLRPVVENLSAALRALSDHGYAFEAGGEGRFLIWEPGPLAEVP